MSNQTDSVNKSFKKSVKTVDEITCKTVDETTNKSVDEATSKLIGKIIKRSSKIDKELEKLQLSIKGNKLVISHQDNIIGNVYQYKGKYHCMCFISQEWVEEINDWYRCCDNECDDHDDIPRTIPYPNNGMDYEVPAIKFIIDNECHLNEAVFKVWKCWKTTNK
ncbi:hypothetical protein [Acanthamoeba polyphaga mimivirus]|uniref:Uncharacterized protein n=1 Tax=Acanthamoeba polyphaga mimivirus TaxID=212035 RepID=A0A0G2XZQ2_MIMIV|nr:hypothetical protein [Acanthamoeba polyphaga mimivirus]